MDPSNLQQQKLDQQRKLDLLKRLLEIHKSSLNAMQSLVAMFEILANDITELEPSLSDTGPGRDRNRRSYVRAVFSAIEGLTYGIKQLALSRAIHFPDAFSRGEIALLYEEAYTLDKGRVRVDSKFLPLLPNIRFAFDRCFHAFEAKQHLAVAEPGWESLAKALQIRNRITHPKLATDLVISDDEMKIIEEAVTWFMKQVSVLIKSTDAGTAVVDLSL